MLDRLKARCWAEVSLDNIAHNYRLLRERSGVEVCGIVKADAYGHGAVEVTRLLLREGCRFFAVSTLDEAAELRDAGIAEQILILGYTSPVYVSDLLGLNLIQTVVSVDAAAEYNSVCAELGKKLRCHLKIDTGMTRYGFAELPRFEDYTFLEFEGAFTHFPVSDEKSDESIAYTNIQIERFRSIAAPINKTGFKLHCANSGGVLGHFSKSCAPPFNMARPGIALYGQYRAASELRHCMAWKTRVCQIREVAAGTSVSYGRTWTASRPSRIAVLSIGYGDGLSRALSNRGEVWINGARAPIAGRVCMDLTMADVTDIPNVRVGDEVEIFGEHISTGEVADLLGTITYEVLCNVGKRVPRIYSRNV